MNRKKKENIFFIYLWKKGKFIFLTKKKKKKLNGRTNVYYIQICFLEGREGVYFKLKYLLPYLQFFVNFIQNCFW